VNSSGHGDVFLQSDFDEWYAANASAVTKVGSVYVVHANSNFKNTVDVSVGDQPGGLLGHVLGSNYLQQFNKRTLVDMGKEISIGIPSNPRLLVFRQVALPYDAARQGSGLIGYVVTENNASNLTHPRFYMAVARA
jgi:hypothetical protein